MGELSIGLCEQYTFSEGGRPIQLKLSRVLMKRWKEEDSQSGYKSLGKGFW